MIRASEVSFTSEIKVLESGGTAMRALSDYMKQRREGRDPVFKAKNIALKEKTDYWT